MEQFVFCQGDPGITEAVAETPCKTMFEHLIRSVENAFVEFNLRRVLYLMFIIGMLLVSLYVFDRSTGYSFYSRYEQKLSALEKLQEVQDKGLSPDLTPIFNDLVNTLRYRSDKSLDFSFTYAPVLKVLSASLFFWWMVVVGLLQRLQGVQDWNSLVIGASAFGVIATALALLIPTFYSPWINAAIYAFLQIMIAIALTRYGNRIRARNSV